MRIKITKTGKLFSDNPGKKLTAALKSELTEALTEQKDALIKRTRSGKDVRGQFFKSYTPKYAEKRASMGLQKNPVNLTVTGELLDTISTKIEDSGNGKFKLNLEIANGQKEKAKGLQKKREFFGNSQEQEKLLLKRLKELNIKQIVK